MSDEEKELLAALGDLDWDAALDEWAKNSFLPDPPREGEPNAAKDPPAPLAAVEDPENPQRPTTRAAPSQPSASTEIPDIPAAAKLGEISAEGTLIAPVPSELRDAPAPTSRRGVTPTSLSRGGLGQLFSRPPPPPRRSAERPALAPPPPRTHSERPRLGSISDVETADRLPEDEPRTIARSRTSEPSASIPAPVPSAPRTERDRPRAPEGPTAFDAERPASRWLDDQATAAYRFRAEWLEEEARKAPDRTEQARALLAVSELFALADDEVRAATLAAEARELAPHLPLVWRQARQLRPGDLGSVAALDNEAARSPTAAARAHATLLAADLLRTSGEGDAAVERWNSAYKLDPSDVRAPVARAALALAQGDHGGRVFFLAENSELVPIDRAFATALRMRGVPRVPGEAHAMPINDGLRRARAAIAAHDVVAAAQATQEIAAVPELSQAALWLSASFGCAHIASRRASARALKTLANDGDGLARRALVARGVELADPELVLAGLAGDAPVDARERAAVLALTGQDTTEIAEELERAPELASLVDALTSLMLPAGIDEALVRSTRVAGAPAARAHARLGRMLVARLDTDAIDDALANLGDEASSSAAGVAIETAIRAKRWAVVRETVAALPAPAGPAGESLRDVATAVVAERAGDPETAARAWALAVEHGTLHEGVVRIAASLDSDIDVASELLRIADALPAGTASAVIHLEALARKPSRPDREQSELLGRVHRAAPALGIGAFLAERVSRRSGDLDDVLRWIQERRATATDPLEAALESVREALLVADHDPELASTLLEQAHRARVEDVALRELYERLASEAPSDGAAWREARAADAAGFARAQLFTEAALDHERAGDMEGARRAATLAEEAGGSAISRLVRERAELETGAAQRQADVLLDQTRRDDDAVRLIAYERLAELEAHARGDLAAARTWHERLLEHDGSRKPSLRFMEHALISAGTSDADPERDLQLERIAERIALALDGTGGGEVTAHAQLAARLRVRRRTADGGGWDRTADMVRLAATQPEPSLWALRMLNAHARLQGDDEALVETSTALVERTQRSTERAALLLRASEAAARLERVAEARTYLERAASEDPGDVVTWGFLAEVRERLGDIRATAEACESLARSSAVSTHQLLAWCDSAKIWLDEVHDAERGMSALESAAELDVTYGDVFERLSPLYAERGLGAELAHLLERRLAKVEDEGERVALEVELARALAELGDVGRAKETLDAALRERPDHTAALSAYAELCCKEGDWAGAEQTYIRLARLLTALDDQCAVYEKLGELYASNLGNLSRAEVAYKEVLKRRPTDAAMVGKLIALYKRQGDVARTVEAQQQLVSIATDPAVRLARLIDLASIHETFGRDPRRAEQVLDSARKEFPTSVVALRAMADLYVRQRQLPAMQILLDRAAGDARRAFAQGRFVPALFEVLHAAFDLRGKRDAARVVAATLGAIEGQRSTLLGADAAAIDPQLDDLLAPEVLSSSLRVLLARAGDALDAVAPVDLRSMRAAPLVPGSPIASAVGAIAMVVGLGALQIFVSPNLGKVAIPLSSSPPALLVGTALAEDDNDRARTFVIMRAMKLILAHSSALSRGTPDAVPLLVSALFSAFNPRFVAQSADAKRVIDLAKRVRAALPRDLDPTVGVIALEAAGLLGAQGATLAAATHSWANRVALLAIGDPNGALDALAWARGERAAPTGSEERAAWVARTPEARDLMAFSVSEQYAEARARLRLDR